MIEAAILLGKVGLSFLVAFASFFVFTKFINVDVEKGPNWLYVLIGIAVMIMIACFGLSGILVIWSF